MFLKVQMYIGETNDLIVNSDSFIFYILIYFLYLFIDMCYNHTKYSPGYSLSGGSSSNEGWWKVPKRLVSQLEIQQRSSYFKTGWSL